LATRYCQQEALNSPTTTTGDKHETQNDRSSARIDSRPWAMPAQAQDPIKVGVIAAFSGPFADDGKQMQGGIKAWMAQHGDTVAGRKIQVIYKDTTGPSPRSPSGWRRNWWCATRSTSWPASA
jgi:ABC-type branched-subunit amino acid transport system substrate-binding protein